MLNLNVMGETKYLANMQIHKFTLTVTGSTKVKAN